MMPADNDL